ncbi:MAG TPA: glycine cleavage system protein H [Candidatus Limnocylindrales bacterium]|nr:glycine cleavage system protein H [Candidatus Limnocylindrales bacterium]
MEGIRFIDIYATKGIEYLIVISFLAAFVFFCRYMYRSREAGTAAKVTPSSVTRFRVPEGLFYHQGHGWLRPEPGSVGVVGLDDFAQKLIGKIDAVELPPVGSRLAQGDRGWSLVVDAVPIPMLSPVAGEVVEVNQEVLRSPEILREDPYGKGWLLKVKSTRIAANTRNLLSGKLARAWMENALDNLHPVRHESLGPVLQDGGLPLEGIARVLGGEKWQDLAKGHLLTDRE